MARPLNQDRRRQLLEGTVAYAARHGLAELSLRPLARFLGTSDRMLLHYFGSKENLIGQALSAGRPDVPTLVGDLAPEALSGLAHRQWHDMTSGDAAESRLRVLLEVMALAIAQPDLYGAHATAAVTDWARPVANALRRRGISKSEAQARATVLISGLRGIALDLYVTGDRERTAAAAELLIAAATGAMGSGTTGRRQRASSSS